ncbi:hypothetical protein Vi05172_g1470 [Venturia inaequalis]|nr:hypothetical protein Vi05172_g1470 [Venturia inaequalis]
MTDVGFYQLREEDNDITRLHSPITQAITLRTRLPALTMLMNRSLTTCLDGMLARYRPYGNIDVSPESM